MLRFRQSVAGFRYSLSISLFGFQAANGLRYLRWGGDGEAVQL
jgi:hypothetical protein